MENKELNEQTSVEKQSVQQENIIANEENATVETKVVDPIDTKVEENVVKEVVADVPILNEGEAATVKEENKAIEAENEIQISDEEIISDCDNLSRKELVDELEKLVSYEDLNEIKLHITAIRESFNRCNKEFKQELETAFLATAIEGQKFEYEADEIDRKFEKLNNIYKQRRQEYLIEQENIKKANLVKKNEILAKLKNIVENEEVNKKIYDEFRELQEAWRQIGVIPKEESDELWQSYHFVVERFFDKVKINNELRELDFKKNLEAKIEICEKAEELFLEENLSLMTRKLQALHAQWREVGTVSKDKRDEIWERFKNISEKLNSRRQEYFDGKSKELQANYEAKLALIDKAKELLSANITSIKEWQDKALEHAEIFKLWKTIGHAPKEHHDEVWKEFRAISDTFFTNKNEYFNKLKSEQNNNYNIKVDLCVKAEAIKDSVDWGSTSKELIKLQKEWKNVGPVPQRLSEKIWKRFRAACDEFFNAKAEYFSHINENETKNLELKKEIIEKVGSFEYGDDKSANLQILKDFQKQWFEVGHVPMKEKDTLHKAFRLAIDQQMEKLGISSIDMTDSHFRSRIDSLKKESGGSERAISKEVNSINERINIMKEEISLWENNIEFFSKSKNSELLRAEFERKIEKAKKDLKVQQLKLDYLRNNG